MTGRAPSLPAPGRPAATTTTTTTTATTTTATTAATTAATGGARGRGPVFKTSLAELIADVLRLRIVSGELGDGDLLPRQEDLIEEFNVGKSSIREALRILEAEGLVTVKRGKSGGAVVHAPDTADAAHPLGLVLQSQGVPLSDLGEALQALEPVCARLCARRPDRKTTLVPKLKEVLAATIEALDDEGQALRCSREFHDLIVRGCGNQTLITVIGALETIWFAHELDWSDRLLGRFPMRRRREGVAAHERLLRAVEAGDGDAAFSTMWAHMAKDTYAVSREASAPELHGNIGRRRALR